MGAPESHYDWLRLHDRRLDRGLAALGGPPYGSVVTTDRRFHLSFDGHSWPDLMEPSWEPTETNVIFLGWEHMCGVLRKDSEGQYRAIFDKAVQIAVAETNACTNPSAEINVAGWIFGGSGLTRVATDYVYGDYCFQLLANFVGGYARDDLAVAGGSTWTFSLWVKTTSSDIRIYMYDTVAAAPVAEDFAQGTGRWEYITITGTMGAGAGNLRFYVSDTRAAGWDNVYFDAVNIVEAAYSTPCIDGSLGAGHAWTGAAHASTSTRAAAVLEYPNDVVAYPSGNCYEQLTIAGWFIPAWSADGLTGTTIAWDIRGANNNNRIFINFDSAGNVWNLYVNGAVRCASAAQTFNSWEPQFIVATLDFDADEFMLFVNDDTIITDTTVLTPPVFGASLLHIGNAFNDTLQFNGLIDDFVIYPRVLSADEIHSIYKFGNPLLPPTHANMRVIFGQWTSTDFDGDTFGATGWTTYDLVDGFGIPFGAKAISVTISMNDIGGGINHYFSLRKDATMAGAVTAEAGNQAGETGSESGLVPVANGRTVQYTVGPSGDDCTLYWKITGVFL